MKIDDLKSHPESSETEKPQLTPEQTGMQEKFFRSAVVKRYKGALKNLYQTMSKRKSTIADVKQLIIDKTRTLPFTASQREFIMSFKDEFIVACLKDIYTEKELHAINLTVSESVQTGTGNSGDVQSNS